MSKQSWDTVISIAKPELVNFANGEASGRDLTSAVKFTPAAGIVRGLLRERGVDRTRKAAREALRRRNMV